MLKLSQLLWIVLLACVLTVTCGERAQAKVVLASWYGPGFKGLPTASGEPYDPSGYTTAHKRMPLGTQLVVSYRGRSVEVTVNDRGPYVPGRKLDLSRAAAQYIGLKRVGVDYVDYTRVGRSGAYDDSYYDTYIVQPGDTLYGIAAQLGTTVEYLGAANGIADPDLIYSGQTIYY